MTKIFQLELFVQQIELWKMPTTRQEDEISIDVTVFDCKSVPIKRHDSAESGKNATMSRGQNFLFTLNEIPTDGNQVFFNVFQNTNKKKLVGTGTIPINELFGEVFVETFKQPEVVQPPEKSGQDPSDATNKKTDSKTAQNQKQEKPKQNVTKKNSKKESLQQQQQQNKKGQTSDGKGNAAADNTTPDEIPTENTTKPIAPRFSPISKLTKDIYPIIGTDSNQCGIVCILMRLTSFGNFSAHPIHIHQNHKEIIIQNMENTALYRRLPLDELRNNRHSEDLRFISAFPSNAGNKELIYNRGPEVKDFNFQCNEKDIMKDILQRENPLVDQENVTVRAQKRA
ncbi:uncharacterized protein LOC119076969 [Bradysia coprophila]|uniref:uncharacterized protein LOC119076969 n=1 Tax=Bradysia coprophila TaxID=38358 RepID=UPI00187DB215|nr:uncharacterized protein LOC119076969 [Bradysia coprophila]